MKNLPLLLGTILGTFLLVVGIGYFFAQSSEPAVESAAVDPALIAGEMRNLTGNPESEITIVNFSDFQCPACKSTETLVQQFLAEYGDRVRFIYRHFPIDSLHTNARLAAQAAESAGIDGKFWDYHRLLFERQEDWSQITDKTALIERFAEYAQELEIDKDQFLERIESPPVAELVESDRQAGLEANVNATPTFYVNGLETSAPQLSAVVDSLLPTNQASGSAEDQQ